jgi:RIO kinase 2
MESARESQSDSEQGSESEADEGEDDEELEGDERGEMVERSKEEEGEREDVEEGFDDAVPSGEGESKDEELDGSASAESPSQRPPRSASCSPTNQLGSQLENTLSVNGSREKEKEIRGKAAIDAYKERAREKRKYHSRRGAERIGRAKGSKAKQDNRVKVDKSGLWD